MFCFGALSQRSHPFSFRTRQLSSVEAMILHCGKVARRQNKELELLYKKYFEIEKGVIQFRTTPF